MYLLNFHKAILFILMVSPGFLFGQEPDPFNTYYYEYSSVTFFTSTDSEGNLVGESDWFEFGTGDETSVMVEVDNDLSPFGCDSLNIIVYDEKDLQIDNFYIQIESEWDYARFRIYFSKPGIYNLDVYNEHDTYIITGTIIIEP